MHAVDGDGLQAGGDRGHVPLSSAVRRVGAGRVCDVPNPRRRAGVGPLGGHSEFAGQFGGNRGAVADGGDYPEHGALHDCLYGRRGGEYAGLDWVGVDGAKTR